MGSTHALECDLATERSEALTVCSPIRVKCPGQAHPQKTGQGLGQGMRVTAEGDTAPFWGDDMSKN